MTFEVLRPLLGTLVAVLIAAPVAMAQQSYSARLGARDVTGMSVPGCGSLQNAYGPFDYRDPNARGEPLRKVEEYHFSANIENLQRDARLGSINVVPNLNYVLRAFPNHHRALNAISKWELRGGNISAAFLSSADCYFRRAIVFAPDDAVVRMLYGNYLSAQGKPETALGQYQKSLELDNSSPETHYNLGLLYVQMGQLDSAREQAAVAYGAGYPLPGLKNKIAEKERRSRNQ